SHALLNVSSGAVYNYVFHTSAFVSGYDFHHNTSSQSNAAGLNADLGWETWATIGRAFNDTVTQFTPGAQPPRFPIPPAPVEFNNFAGSTLLGPRNNPWTLSSGAWEADNAAWYITPSDSQGAASMQDASQGAMVPKVLIFQICVLKGSQFNGSFNVTTGTAR